MRSRVINSALVVIGIYAFLSVSGCVNQGPLLVDFQYQPPQGVSVGTVKVVGVSPFRDERGKTASIVGKRTNATNGQVNDLVVQGIAADRVTAALKNALKARGIAEKDFSAWDLTEAGVPGGGADLLISGEIKTLWVDATSQFANTTYKAEVQLRISVADPAQKKIVRVLDVNSRMERQNVIFSTDFVEQALSDALSGAIEQIFSDEELKNKLK